MADDIKVALRVYAATITDTYWYRSKESKVRALRVDLILVNGNFYTMDCENEKAQAVAIEGGIIKGVGSDTDMLALKKDNTQVIDLDGKTAIPGFNDSHLHLLGYSIELNMVDLKDSASIDEIVDCFKKYIIKNNIPEGEMVWGTGWNQTFLKEQRIPTKYDLDKVSNKHIVIADRACHHVCSANSYAMEHFGVNKDTPEIPGGGIVRDEKGEPLGIFNEMARLVFNVNQTFCTEDIEKLILKAAPHLNKMGITSVQSDDFTAMTHQEAVYSAYVNLSKRGEMTLRVNEQCRSSGLEDYKEMLAIPQVDEDVAPYFKLGPVKILADGSLGGRTAFMKEDYHDMSGERGIPIYSREEFNAIVKLCHEKNRPVAIHAIGDATMQWCMDEIKKNQRENPKPNLRHGIIHCQITDKNLLDEFKEHNVIAYIQPIFIHADWRIVVDRVGSAKAATSYAFKTLKNMNVRIPLGTDCPIESFDPLKNIYCAVTRKDLHGNPKDGYNPDEALTVYEAVYGYTVDSAYASYEEDVKGKIKSGMYGDIAVLTKNIFEIEHEEILDTEVAMTVFDGKIVHQI